MAWEGDWGSQLLEAQQGEAVLGMGLKDSPLAALGTEGRLDQWGREQRAGLVPDRHRQGSHMQAVGNSRPEVHTAGLGSRHTLGGSLTWTFHLRGGKLNK